MTLSGVKVEEDCIMKLLPMFCKSLSNDDCIDTGNEIGLPPFTEPFNAPCEFLCDGQHKKKNVSFMRSREAARLNSTLLTHYTCLAWPMLVTVLFPLDSVLLIPYEIVRTHP